MNFTVFQLLSVFFPKWQITQSESFFAHGLFLTRSLRFLYTQVCDCDNCAILFSFARTLFIVPTRYFIMHTLVCIFLCMCIYRYIYRCVHKHIHQATPRTISPSYACSFIQMSNVFLILYLFISSFYVQEVLSNLKIFLNHIFLFLYKKNMDFIINLDSVLFFFFKFSICGEQCLINHSVQFCEFQYLSSLLCDQHCTGCQGDNHELVICGSYLHRG